MIHYILKKLYLLITFYLLVFNVQAQFTIEKINFESANPYSFNDIITDLEKQEKQKVFGELVIPRDSIDNEKKIPLDYWCCRKPWMGRTPL